MPMPPFNWTSHTFSTSEVKSCSLKLLFNEESVANWPSSSTRPQQPPVQQTSGSDVSPGTPQRAKEQGNVNRTVTLCESDKALLVPRPHPSYDFVLIFVSWTSLQPFLLAFLKLSRRGDLFVARRQHNVPWSSLSCFPVWNICVALDHSPSLTHGGKWLWQPTLSSGEKGGGASQAAPATRERMGWSRTLWKGT